MTARQPKSACGIAADIGACAGQRKGGSLAPFSPLIWSFALPMTAIRDTILKLDRNGIAVNSLIDNARGCTLAAPFKL